MPSPCTLDAAHQSHAVAPEMPARQLPRHTPASRRQMPCRAASQAAQPSSQMADQSRQIRICVNKTCKKQGSQQARPAEGTALPSMFQCSRHTIRLVAILDRLHCGADCQIWSRLRAGGASDHHYRLSGCAPHAIAALGDGCQSKLVAGRHALRCRALHSHMGPALNDCTSWHCTSAAQCCKAASGY